MLTLKIRKGFTLLELIVVIVILGILAAIAIPTFNGVITKSKDASALQTLRSLNRNVLALAAVDAGVRGNVVAADLTTAISETRLPGASSNATPALNAEVVSDSSKIGYAVSGANYGLALRSTSGACLMLVNQAGTTTLFKATAQDCTGTRALAGKQSANGDTDVSSSASVVVVPPAAVAGKTFDPTNTVGSTGDIQTWTVPTTGVYTISATGASGGLGRTTGGTDIRGGYGAKMSASFSLTQGQVIKVVVGQAGTNTASSYAGGGGGGGTYVYTSTNVPLVVAGGGGGAGQYELSLSKDAATTVNGKNGVRGDQTNEMAPGIGGSNGFGGNGSSSYSGGGAGWANSGADSTYAAGGKSPLEGAAGGSNGSPTAPGGFGGGGASRTGGGGGGGYSGGGGGGWAYSGDGGGGGSFVDANGSARTSSVLSTSGAGTASITLN